MSANEADDLGDLFAINDEAATEEVKAIVALVMSTPDGVAASEEIARIRRVTGSPEYTRAIIRAVVELHVNYLLCGEVPITLVRTHTSRLEKFLALSMMSLALAGDLTPPVPPTA